MPGRSARVSRAARPSSATPCCWPRTSAALSPTISLPRATRPTPHNCSRPCVEWPRCEAGRRAPWSPTAALGSPPPPTTAPWPSSASGASGCSAPARPAGPVTSRPGRSTPAQLACGDRGADQPPQALVRAAAHPAAPPGRRADLGRAGDLRLQPAAHDRRRGMKPGGATTPPRKPCHPPIKAGLLHGEVASQAARMLARTSGSDPGTTPSGPPG